MVTLLLNQISAINRPIYLGCTELQYFALRENLNDNHILIDKKKHYRSGDRLLVIRRSIFETEAIIDDLSQLPLCYSLFVQPVADYAIETAFRIQSILTPNNFDYRFLRSKSETNCRLRLHGLPAVIPTTLKSIVDDLEYILVPNQGSESIGVHCKKGRAITSNDFQNYIISREVKGRLINVDLTFNQDSLSPNVDEVYHRINDQHFRTVYTTTNFYDDLFFENLEVCLPKLTNLMAGYCGRLTIDLIWDGEKITMLEISPFHHKPWLREIKGQRNLQSILEFTLYDDSHCQNPPILKDYDEIVTLPNVNAKNARLASTLYGR